MSLTLNQFEVLTLIERKQDEKLTQRDIAQKCNLSLGNANKILAELQELEVLKVQDDSKYEVTLKGYEWLEPYRVKKAIFMAAGFGSRMVPVTLNTPKPLIQVHGKRIIESLLDAVLDAGITDITIVRGYLGEQFDLLLKKYPMIKFVENPIFNEANNISSAYVVRDMLSNAYVLESDLLLYNKEIIRKYEYTTNYLGMPTDRTDDWCFEVKNGIIVEEKVGGLDCWQMVGISYWNEEDGQKLSQDIAEVYATPGGKERYWEQVPLVYRKKNYAVEVNECFDEDIVEIDTFRELKAIDKTYDV